MSNIYDSANALSRGLRELPEYKAVKEARDAIQADAEASKIFADYIAFQHEIQIMAQTGQIPDVSFQEKWKVLASRFKVTLSCQNSLPNSNNFRFTFLILKKLSLNQYQNF
ncbi:hypothetical protein HMPREF1124_0928 [Streptococcus infantis X]|uniref:YlbF family regulator n=1 Tax=Streptococcus infantis X TaxID=997830 RepID=F9PDD0_9STRE|nr:hypothetical protein HMPREF1124_0928 [Streptococcus infantis X]